MMFLREFYVTTPHSEPLFAKQDNGIPFYAKSSNGDEIYPAKQGKMKPIFISDYPLYAKKKNGAEYYPMVLSTQQEFPLHTRDSNEIVYANNELGFEIYPHGYDVRYEQKYAMDNRDRPYYPKDKRGDEYLIESVGYIRYDHNLIYPLLADGRVKYEKDDEGNEVYARWNSFEYIGVDKHFNEIYAKDKNGDEYYPTPFYAASVHGKLQYARTKTGSCIYYKSENGHEQYIFDEVNGQDIIEHLEVYRKDASGDEWYPIQYISDDTYTELILHDRYAKNKDGNEFYPLDVNGNEYIHKDRMIDGWYPITNDGWAIVPQKNNKPILFPNYEPLVSLENITSVVVVDGKMAFLTNVKSIRSSRSPPKTYTSQRVHIPLNAKPKTTSDSIKIKATVKNDIWKWVLAFMVMMMSILATVIIKVKKMVR